MKIIGEALTFDFMTHEIGHSMQFAMDYDHSSIFFRRLKGRISVQTSSM
jgi:hypothetical protein